MTVSDVRWACSAHIDLLGFSDHLVVANSDIRNQTGKAAIERLSSLEAAIQLFELERRNHPELYPSTLQFRRFNDTLFLGVDAEYLLPPAGQTKLTGGYSYVQLRALHPKEGQTVLNGTTAESGRDIAFFLGLVARVHEYVNSQEKDGNFPGCRTVVASGLRKCFKGVDEKDDFFSANLSVSTAFEADKLGSSAGLTGNNLYVEDDAGVAISYCEPCHAILGFAKFVREGRSLVDPYRYIKVPKNTAMAVLPGSSLTIPEPITLEIMHESLTFRRLNPVVLTNFQLLRDYQRLDTESEEFNKKISDSLSTSTPSLEEVRESNSPFGRNEYPFLSLEFSLDAKYSEFFGEEQPDDD